MTLPSVFPGSLVTALCGTLVLNTSIPAALLTDWMAFCVPRLSDFFSFPDICSNFIFFLGRVLNPDMWVSESQTFSDGSQSSSKCESPNVSLSPVPEYEEQKEWIWRSVSLTIDTTGLMLSFDISWLLFWASSSISLWRWLGYWDVWPQAAGKMCWYEVEGLCSKNINTSHTNRNEFDSICQANIDVQLTTDGFITVVIIIICICVFQSQQGVLLLHNCLACHHWSETHQHRQQSVHSHTQK